MLPHRMCSPVNGDDGTARAVMLTVLVARAPLFGFHLTLIVPRSIVCVLYSMVVKA